MLSPALTRFMQTLGAEVERSRWGIGPDILMSWGRDIPLPAAPPPEAAYDPVSMAANRLKDRSLVGEQNSTRVSTLQAECHIIHRENYHSHIHQNTLFSFYKLLSNTVIAIQVLLHNAKKILSYLIYCVS